MNVGKSIGLICSAVGILGGAYFGLAPVLSSQTSVQPQTGQLTIYIIFIAAIITASLASLYFMAKNVNSKT